MKKSVFAVAAAILAAALFSLAGCSQGEAPAQNATGNASFILPGANASYHATYTVEEGGPMVKEVWRAQGMMRMDMSAQGIRALSFYFIGGKAYSCSLVASPVACYDITLALAQGDAARLVPSESGMAGATRVESVKIGSTTGNCYEEPMGALGTRKLCFAPQGVVAFDSYNVSKEILHTEYLTDLEYYDSGSGPGADVFSLPAAPVPAPPVPEPPDAGFEG